MKSNCCSKCVLHGTPAFVMVCSVIRLHIWIFPPKSPVVSLMSSRAFCLSALETDGWQLKMDSWKKIAFIKASFLNINFWDKSFITQMKIFHSHLSAGCRLFSSFIYFEVHLLHSAFFISTKLTFFEDAAFHQSVIFSLHTALIEEVSKTG